MNTINNEDIFKIKDSVDIFLTDNKYITTYFMNSRIRKNFKKLRTRNLCKSN